MEDGGAHTHAGGFLSKEAVNPSVQMDAQIWLFYAAGGGAVFQ